MSSAELNALIARVARRAENAPDLVLRDSFVPVPNLLAHLESPDHHVLFGRRGTGKTHLLRYLQAGALDAGSLAIYLDLRKIGSPEDVSGAAGDFAPRSTALLVDVLEAVHTALCEQLLSDRWNGYLGTVGPGLDALAEAATQIRVVGEVEVEHQEERSVQSERSRSVELSAARDPRAAWKADSRHNRSARSAERTLSRGRESHHLLLGPLSGALRQIADALAPHQLWLLVDEWSALPSELQPLMADLLRRTFFATSGVVVKVTAVHGRSRFSEQTSAGGEIGLELGADTAATLDLDDFLLFRNNSGSTLDFYASLLHRHLAAMSEQRDGGQLSLGRVDSPDSLIRTAFASRAAFHNLVLGAEGVPRDALQIAGLAASAAFDQPITTQHVGAATRDFFLRDKESHIPRGAPRAVFTNLVDLCVRHKSRIIPLRRNGESDDEVIKRLYDTRVIHRVRQGVSLDPNHPTDTYDVYVIDYGCFLGLLNSGRIRALEDGLDPGARFADADEVEIRARSFTALARGWYRQPTRR
jgi:hypothetical protein